MAVAMVAMVTQAQQAASGSDSAASVSTDDQFNIFEYRVLGNTKLSARDIEMTLEPHLGMHKTVADVELARQVLEKLYKERGYGAVYVDIPEQRVDSSIVRLNVTEGKIDRVRITGAHYFSNGKIRERLGALRPGTVMNLSELQTQLGQVNQQSRDRLITPILKPGRTTGTVDVELKVQDSLPVHGSVEFNNRYSANTTRTRASLTASYDNLFQRFHSLSFQYQTTPEKISQTRVLAATYLAPLADSGNLLAVYAVDTNSDFAVVSTGGDLSVLGAGNIYGIRFIIRLPTTPRDTQSLAQNFSHTVTLGGDYKDFKDNIRLASGVTDTTPIKYLAWSVAYGGNYTTERSATAFNIGGNFGLRGVVNDEVDFAYKRNQAKANYFYLRADASETLQLWRKLSGYLRIAGQWTGDPLISNEQFSVGGAESVRGYLESAQLGDTGVNSTFELRTAVMQKWFASHGSQLGFFLFYDAARMHQIKQRIESGIAYDVNTNLSSAGVGLRFAGFKGFQAALDWAYPLKPLGEISKGDSRTHFQVRYGF